MDFDMAHYLLTEGRRKEKENSSMHSPSKEAYRKCLAETLLNNQTRILAFKSKPSASIQGMIFNEVCSSHLPKSSAKPCRYIPQVSNQSKYPLMLL
ncbi:hypothetical protein QJS04_geneDACA017949 [Acorus gramineus]|uniref:Uncharacterized protein n=1 Tax=Acorus gramineus TaxID=55184 RepID=A0AAV9A7D2_ACOGR|nr:hypothetical protein QJS04_geneDACA017949 [Acorus gramineus]